MIRLHAYIIRSIKMLSSWGVNVDVNRRQVLLGSLGMVIPDPCSHTKYESMDIATLLTTVRLLKEWANKHIYYFVMPVTSVGKIPKRDLFEFKIGE